MIRLQQLGPSPYSRPPYFILTFGIVLIVVASVFAIMGKAWVRFSGWVCRAKEPGWFWFEVALHYFMGGLLIGYFLLKLYGLPT